MDFLTHPKQKCGLFFLGLLVFSMAEAKLPQNYQSLPAVEKRDLLYQNVCESPYSTHGLPDLNIQASWSALTRAFSFLNLNESFSHNSDEMPYGRGKVIHALGSVAPIVFISSNDHPFTGLLSEPEVLGLARLSLAAPPVLAGYTPGMALKFFVDKKPSLNLQVMASLEGQGSNHNLFSEVFSNSLPPIRSPLRAKSLWEAAKRTNLKILEKFFATAKADPRYLSIEHLSSTLSNGNPVEHPVSPEVLSFQPSASLKSSMKNALTKDHDLDFRSYLNGIDSGLLYEVFASHEGQKFQVGQLLVLDSFCASAYGDQRLFFQHHR